MSAPAPFTVLHYTGATDDRGGVMSVVRALAGTGQFDCVLGVSPGFVARRSSPLRTMAFPAIEAERIGWRTFWQARAIARVASGWLADDARRVFHAHSRSGLVAALWLARRRERRVVVSVHCYGRQRWFYRFAARRLGGRLFWLSPAMKRYYGVARHDSWTQCIPGCVPETRGIPGMRRKVRDTLRLAGVGMLVRWKRWHLIVEAIAALPGGIRERVRFDHIGGPGGMADAERYAAELRVATAQHGLENVIGWRGEQASSTPLLSESDCLVVASDHEPFSIAVLEALSAGVPVLAADSGGAQDLIVAGRGGWFFRSGDSASLAARIVTLATTDALDRTAITEEMVEPFTAPVVARQWARVYAGL
jgi:glycosyltransferase involved in cell wall biosynthesis